MHDSKDDIVISNFVITNNKTGRKILSAMLHTWLLESNVLIDSFIQGRNLRKCNVCKTPVVYIGEYNTVIVFRCIDCLKYYTLNRYNELEVF